MWKNKDLKTEAKGNLKRNYWAIVAVCFLLLIITAEYSSPTSSLLYYTEDNEYIGEVEREFTKATIVDEAGNLYENIMDEPLSLITKEASRNKGGTISFFVSSATSGMDAIRSEIKIINDLVMGHRMLSGILNVLGLIVSLAFLIFVKEILKIGERRFFLESRLYHETRIVRILYIYRKRKLFNTAIVMGLRALFIVLWAFTIVGFFYKYYQYKMIPYILAENPDIKYKEAFRITKEMTKGKKWRMFLLDLSFTFWFILGILTLGILNIFFITPYYVATESELYVTLRRDFLRKNINYCAVLNDGYLYRRPEDFEFGMYPGLEHKRKHEVHSNYKRNYSLENLVLMFFAFCIIGWVWEVVLFLVKDVGFVNRGFLNGPWLPIYGAGGVLVLILLKKIREKPILTFFTTMALCGILEFATSYVLEVSSGIKMWDYGGYFLNIGGRVCLESVLVFAIAGAASIYLISPWLDDRFNKIPRKIKHPLCLILVLIFSADIVYTHLHPNVGEGITVNYK